MSAPPQPPLAMIRAVNWLAAPCILDAIMVGRLDREFVDALILLAVVQANVAPLMRDRDTQRAYASFDAPPPDELRRPVSINAVAHSLRLPYETVRRRVMRLAASGACEVSAHGVIVPTRELTSPQHMAAMLGIWAQIRRLYIRLRDIGALGVLLPSESTPASDSAAPPLRAVMRIASDYMLRTIDNISREFDGLISGLIWYAVMTANHEHLEGGFAEDLEPRPVRAMQIAERLKAPAETVRRHVVGLLDAGLCQRVRGGLIIPSEVVTRPAALRAMHSNFVDLQRMFAGFAQLGVLGEWERQSPALEGVA